MRGIIGYFGFDLADSVVQKRIAQWRHAGFQVRSFAFTRAFAKQQVEASVDLGHTMPLSRWRRILPMGRAMLRLWSHRGSLAGVELFVARNLDMLLLALFARWIAHSPASIVYEVLDVNFSCVAAGWQGTVLRSLEKWSMSRINLLVVSSPDYVDHYYRAVLGYGGAWLLLENKLPKYIHPARAVIAPPITVAPERRWKIGWFGYLDDRGSWAALRALAVTLPDRVTIHVHGRANADFDLQRFLSEVQELPNVFYGGAYKNPDDLAALYGAVDIVWSVDCTSLVGNPRWLLTNGLYEAGFFGKPILAFADNGAMCRMVIERNCGWCLLAPLAPALQNFIRQLSWHDYREKCRAIESMPDQAFVELDEIERIWSIATQASAREMAKGRRREQAAR